ncbi:MAG: Preprotein translocase subunit YidC [Candidatus Uhrbacteria bacterium GW2011_GWD2_52_7]|uniref:Preprotein translocase subunit YidC n=1 Tax=Candidatus Uhrbacteria bacterium GW2011_GWD2_52_7 TaxID=1618989 RepID=A0A0G1XFX7_9BACT|nr:MAG: Preprotein translocase subunit YidC [Candidatus Uhrbacteria bacterium GW2011_GWD2_52_7]
MGELFFTLLYQPLYNLLIVIYNFLPWGGAGLAIIVLTIIVKGLLLPLTFKSLKAQKELQEIQPKIAEIKEQYKDDIEVMAKELMAVYKTHNVNPFASCLPTIVQLFVFLALYQALSAGIGTINSEFLYSAVANPGTMNHIFLGIDLGKVSIPLAILAALMQYLQAKQMITRRPPKAAQGSSASLDEDMAASMNKMLVTFLPLMMLVIGSTTLAGGLTLYIFVSTLFTYALYSVFLRPKPTVK